MWKQVGVHGSRTGRFMPLAFLAHVLLCANMYAQESWSYGLRWARYSASARTLLLTAIASGGEKPTQLFVCAYDEQKKSIKYLSPTGNTPFDFAWIPGKTAFVVTHDNGMTLYQPDGSVDGYARTAIECPVGVLYKDCAWSPSGQWLAVNCFKYETGGGLTLGLYALAEKKFVVSTIPSGIRSPIWKDDATVYVTADGNVAEVRLEGAAPRITRTVLSAEDLTLFYGLFGGQTLVLKETKVLLGKTVLAELDRIAIQRVIATATTIFVSPSSARVIAFDLKGQEIGKAKTEGVIKFGSIGRESNTVFGLRGSHLVSVRVQDSRMEIKDICDLSRESMREIE